MKSNSSATETSGKKADSWSRYFPVQPVMNPGAGRDSNDYLVQARLPAQLYSDFWAYLKTNGLSKSQGIRKAIQTLLNNN